MGMIPRDAKWIQAGLSIIKIGGRHMKNLIIKGGIVFCILFVNSCTNGSLLNSKSKELYSIKIPNKNYTLSIFHLPSSATIQSAIQVRKKFFYRLVSSPTEINVILNLVS